MLPEAAGSPARNRALDGYRQRVDDSSTGMSEHEVLRVLDAIGQAGCRAWVAGGWGVDVLVGHRTRTHRDLDLAIDAAGEATVLAALEGLGYAVETDWRPVRVELAAPGGRWVDVHPVVFDDAGAGTQAGLVGAVFTYPAACFVSGHVGGRVVGCLSVEQQLAFHDGYDLREVDVADVVLLHGLRSSVLRRPVVATGGLAVGGAR